MMDKKPLNPYSSYHVIDRPWPHRTLAFRMAQSSSDRMTHCLRPWSFRLSGRLPDREFNIEPLNGEGHRLN